jgi:photosystem II stability/assembly factor-like uncharacterized protein
VTISLTVTEAGSGATQVCFTGDVLGAPSCQPWVASGMFNVTLTTGDSPAKTVTSIVTDNAGLASTPKNAVIGLDTQAPTLSTLVLNANALYSNSTTVNVTTTASDNLGGSGIQSIAFQTNGGTFSGYNPYATPFMYGMAAGDGTKTVGGKVRDAAGNESSILTDDILLDTTAPVVTLAHSNSLRYTNASTVTLNVSYVETGSAINRFCAKTSVLPAMATPPSSAADSCFAASFITPLNVTISPVDGDKRVSVWLSDNAGNVSAMPGTYDIWYDLTVPLPPASVQVIPHNHFVTVSWPAATDASSGISEYQLGRATSSGGAYSYGPRVSTLSTNVEVSNGTAFYYIVRAYDRANNVSVISPESVGIAEWPFAWQHRDDPSSVDQFAVKTYVAAGTEYWVTGGDNGSLFFNSNNMVAGSFIRRDALTDAKISTIYRNGSTLFAAGANGHIAFTNDNNGSSFTKFPSTIPISNEVTGISFANAPLFVTNYVAVGSGGLIARGGFSFLGPFGFAPLTPAVTTQNLRSVFRCAGAASGECSAGVNANGVLVAVGDNGTILRSTDAAATWATITAPAGYTGLNLNSVVAAPNSNVMYIAVTNPPTGGSGILVSNSGGLTWSQLAGFADFFVRDISIGSDNVDLWVAGFTNLAVRQIRRFNLSTSSVTTVVTTVFHNAIAAASTSEVSALGANGSALYTANFGVVAPVEINNNSTNTITDITIPATFGSTLWMVGQAGLVKSTTNGGGTWSDLSIAGSPYLRGVASVSTPAGSYVVAVGGVSVGPGILVRKPVSTTVFSAHPSSGGSKLFNDVACRNSLNVVNCVAVGESGTVFDFASPDISTNDGAWTSSLSAGLNHYNGVVNYVAGAPINAVRTVVVGVGAAVRTRTGTTWAAETALPGSVQTYYAIAARSNLNGQLMAVGTGGSMVFSTDHGVTWANMSPVGYSTALFLGVENRAGTDEWYVTGNAGLVLKGTYNGTTFTWVRSVTMTNETLYGVCASAASNTRVWAVGTNGTVLFSSNAGNP